ncbi:uncharacterized protein F5891DRAFT_1185573 [Suillus fuscotomentosus]|uniref:Uncharacterized protein n=1 Tax=Suillus fuscotomentosus TaxID=1912939 RepID=A0AAD4EC31_9AGAM|nr:uncharacterized protein F5891DRAFT_1185573 [Suillus fuscotomentosus]KAG1903426.1 hypothetical protein F5891DRAFT_1185573 [Suillus fuscotomentosus]
MPRIRNDPNFNVCPDYATLPYAAAREQIMNEHITEVQVVQFLWNIWEAANNTEKALWLEQVGADKEQHDQLCFLQEEQEERQECEKLEEEEAVRKEEKKKYKHKYTPIQASGVLDEPTIMPSAYAIRKLDKGEYMELWYFTNNGLDEVHIKKTTIEEDVMVLSSLPDGSTAWVSSTSARNASSVINNKDLSFEDFCQACPRFIAAIEEANWPTDHIRMLAVFWKNLQVHKYCSLQDPIAQKTLLAYQVEQQKRWHVVAKTAAGPYDLSAINTKVLERTRDKVYWQEHSKRDNQRDYRVSNAQTEHLRIH